MKCNKCGKEQSDKAVVCPYCGFRLPKEISKEATPERSTLIEFPSASNRSDKSLRNNVSTPVSNNNDWRAELSAKVRQVKERRNMQEARGRLQAELEAAAHRYQQANNSQTATAIAPAMITGLNTNLDLETDRPTNPVIEAALKRVQRASEIAVKKQPSINNSAGITPRLSQSNAQSLPQPQSLAQTKAVATASSETTSESITPNQSPVDFFDDDSILDNITPDPLLMSKIDRESVSIATSSAPSTTSVTSARIISATIPKTLSTPTLGATAVAPLVFEEEDALEYEQIIPVTEKINIPQNEREYDFLAQVAETENRIESQIESETESETDEPRRTVRVIKESEVGPNYLDELIAVSEQNRSLSSDAANPSQRLIAATLDLFIIIAASSVFWGTSYILGINISDERVISTLSFASVFIGLVYLTMMVFVAARTFGMMFVGTRVINSNTKESPSILQAMFRAVGYFLSVGLLGLGFIWMFLDHERRAFHDIISGTFVVRDY